MTAPSLVVRSAGPMSGTTLTIDRAEMFVGRRPDCDLVLNDDFVSRKHAVLRLGPDGVRVEDLGSTGKTFVNGDAIAGPRLLKDGDKVRFGPVETVFRGGLPVERRTLRADQPLAGATPAGGVADAALRRSVLADGSIVCLACGTKNRPGSVFCGNQECGAFLEFTGAGAVGRVAEPPEVDTGPPTAPDQLEPERPERRTPQEPVHAGVAASLSVESLSVEPGGDTTCEVTVRNTGSIVDGLRVTVEGEAAGWASVEPATLRLMPGSEGVATVRFRPPREPTSRAGRASFEVRASSVDNPQTAAVTYGTLDVGEFHETAVELTPNTSRGARTAVHRFKVDNRGNAPIALQVLADDPDELLQFTTTPSSLLIEPGGSGASRVQVRARKMLWWGPTRSFPLRVVAKPDGEEPVRADGAFSQLPRFPRWFRKALLWPIGLSAMAVIGLIAFIATRPAPAKPVIVPNCVAQDVRRCTVLLEDVGLKLLEKREPNRTAPLDQVVMTQPASGASVKKGSTVIVSVSEALKVPNDLVGRTELDARTRLLALGFVVPTPPGMEEGGQKGLVVRTLPPAGEVLTAGAEVQLVVSAGPTTTTSTSSTTTSTTRPTTTTSSTTTSTSTTTTVRQTTTVTTSPSLTTTRT